MENVNTNLRFKMVEQNKAVRRGEGVMVRFPFLKALSLLAVIVVVIILFSLVFTILKTNETFPSCSLKNTCQHFRALKKKAMKSNLAGAILF